MDLEAVAKTEALNTDAAKFKISVRPKGRKGSRQSRKSRQVSTILAFRFLCTCRTPPPTPVFDLSIEIIVNKFIINKNII